jgi:hypothetical protein
VARAWPLPGYGSNVLGAALESNPAPQARQACIEAFGPYSSGMLCACARHRSASSDAMAASRCSSKLCSRATSARAAASAWPQALPPQGARVPAAAGSTRGSTGKAAMPPEVPVAGEACEGGGACGGAGWAWPGRLAAGGPDPGRAVGGAGRDCTNAAARLAAFDDGSPPASPSSSLAPPPCPLSPSSSLTDTQRRCSSPRTWRSTRPSTVVSCNELGTATVEVALRAALIPFHTPTCASSRLCRAASRPSKAAASRGVKASATSAHFRIRPRT